VHRNRLLLLAAAVAAAVIVVVVLIAVGAGKDSKQTVTGSSPRSTHAQLFNGVPQHGATLGSPAAPATLTAFEDPQCPFCREWNENALGSVIGDFVRPGKLKLVYRGVNIIGPNSEQGLRAIYAAAQQNKLWNVVEALYDRQGAENSGWITNGVILAAARDAGANGPAIVAGMGASTVDAALNAAQKQATADHLQGTPTFIIQRPPAVAQQLPVPGLDPASFVSALAAALQ
jgi:protein-disulfide isomerase